MTSSAQQPETLVRIIDLCGREPPRIVDLSILESGDVDHILDMWAEGNTAFIGEFEYQECVESSI